jgi:hypothetical protein
MKQQPVDKQTPSISEEQLEGLCALMPHVFSEGKIDFEKLRASLGDFADERPERYSFTWAGKRDAIRILQTPSRARAGEPPSQSSPKSYLAIPSPASRSSRGARSVPGRTRGKNPDLGEGETTRF